MASVTKQDIPNEANMMAELWKLVKDYYIPEAKDQYWQGLSDRCEQIYQDCPSRLTFYLLHGFLDYLQEKMEEK